MSLELIKRYNYHENVLCCQIKNF